MTKYRKKPITIEAMQLNNHTDMWEIIDWAHTGLHPAANSIIIEDFGGVQIRTLEGWSHASFGDWIIKGIQGEFDSIKSNIFLKTYERVE